MKKTLFALAAICIGFSTPQAFAGDGVIDNTVRNRRETLQPHAPQAPDLMAQENLLVQEEISNGTENAISESQIDAQFDMRLEAFEATADLLGTSAGAVAQH